MSARKHSDALRKIVALMEQEHAPTTFQFFQSLDSDRSGILSKDELHAGLAQHDLELTTAEMGSLLEDLGGDGTDDGIRLVDFMDAIQRARQQTRQQRADIQTSRHVAVAPSGVPRLDLLSVQREAQGEPPVLERVLTAMAAQNMQLFAFFRALDMDGSGTVSVGELRAAFVRFGVTVNAYEVKEFLTALDHDGDGEIEVIEFMDAVEAHMVHTERQGSVESKRTAVAFASHTLTETTDSVNAQLTSAAPELQRIGVLHGSNEGAAVVWCADCRAYLQGLRLWKISGRTRFPAFLALLCSLTLPMINVATDWAVTFSFYINGDMNWFKTSLTIQLLSGSLSGTLLAGVDLHAKLGKTSRLTPLSGISFMSLIAHSGMAGGTGMAQFRSYPLGLVLGLLGLSHLVHVGVCLSGHMSSAHILEKMKLYKAIDLVFEALPQSLLQAWVGVVMGQLDSSSPSFSALITTSLCVSILGAGVTCFTLEAIGRNGNAMSRNEIVIRSRYGVTVVLLRSAQHCVLVLSMALLGCAFGAWAMVAVVLGVTVFFCMGYEAVDREQNYRHAAFLYLVFVLLIAATVATFVLADHVANNYNDKLLGPGGPDDPQYYFCGDRIAAIVPATVCFFLTLVLFPVSAAVDPILGLDSCKAQTCESVTHCGIPEGLLVARDTERCFCCPVFV